MRVVRVKEAGCCWTLSHGIKDVPGLPATGSYLNVTRMSSSQLYTCPGLILSFKTKQNS